MIQKQEAVQYGHGPERHQHFSAAEIAYHLGGKRSGNGYEACCPAHDDHRPSLAISDGEKGVVVYCHAGCEQDAVLDALRARGLWPSRDGFGGANGSRAAAQPSGFATPARPVRRQAFGRLVAEYAYTDAGGELLFIVERYEPKTFRQRQPDGTYSVKGISQVPFRLPKVVDAIRTGVTVYIVEGEKDVLALESIGYVATCNAGGAGKWRDVHSQYLRDADVVVIADNDPPGRKHAESVAQQLLPIARRVRIIRELPGVSDKGDVSDWLATSSGAEGFLEMVDSVAASFIATAGTADLDDWPDPKPIVGELKPVPEFDAEVLLPDVLRAWVMDEADRMPCPPEFIAAAVLVALGSIIGARCAVKPKARDSWLIVPNLWGGIVGDPAAKKSPAWGVALKPLDRLIAKALKEHSAALADYETAKIVFEAQKDAIEGRIKAAAKEPKKHGDPATIAGELRTHGQKAPAAPILRRYKTNDSTVERLGELLRENPAGLLVLRDELVGLLATWDREGREGERAFFLEAWNGNQSFDTDRIGRGHISVPNVCVSIFGGIQPDKLTGYLEQAAHALANDGMLQRFQVLVYPDPRRWEWRDRAPDKAARDAAFAVFDTLAEFDPVAWGAAPADELAKFPWFCFDDAAQGIFIEWSEDLHRERLENEDEPIVRQHLAKYEKLFPALALVFHLVEGAADGIRGPVGRSAALRAAAWCDFLEDHARRCYGLLKDDGLRAAQTLVEKLTRGALEDGFTLRDVRRHQWRSLTTDDVIQAALEWLEDDHWIRGDAVGGAGPGSGRPTVRYKINPAVLECARLAA